MSAIESFTLSAHLPLRFFASLRMTFCVNPLAPTALFESSTASSHAPLVKGGMSPTATGGILLLSAVSNPSAPPRRNGLHILRFRHA